MIFFVSIHILGVIIAVVCAVFEIESIVFSGPVLSAYGLAITFWAYRKNLAITLCYALAAPTVSIICFVLIFGLHWGPSDAAAPISILLTIFVTVNTILGIFAAHELTEPGYATRPKGPFQYSIASIMGLTLVVAVSMSLIKTFGDGGIALAVLLCYLSLCVWILRRFHA